MPILLPKPVLICQAGVFLISGLLARYDQLADRPPKCATGFYEAITDALPLLHTRLVKRLEADPARARDRLFR